MKKNWKTTLCGATAVLLTALSTIDGLTPYKEVLLACAGVATALGLFFAKDSNVTGGTAQQ